MRHVVHEIAPYLFQVAQASHVVQHQQGATLAVGAARELTVRLQPARFSAADRYVHLGALAAQRPLRHRRESVPFDYLGRRRD